MEGYQIVPWDDLLLEDSPNINLEQYVPPELEELARKVCESYDMRVNQMTLITSKPDKGGAIWRIETNHGARSLKVLHRTPERSLFSVAAQEYVVANGGRVPAIIHTKDDRNSVAAGGKLWIVTDWIVELAPVAKIDLDGSMTLCHGLGEFHQWTKGYVPPPEAGKSSRIYKWDSQYQKIMSKIGWFRHLANAYRDTEASAHLLSVLDMFEGQAQDIYKRFQASSYSKMVRKGGSHWGLAHQDYGWSNGQMGPGGIWVIDLDGVAFDLPIRDLRKIITSTMDDMGAWDIVWIRGVIEAYHRANPLDRETFELLWLDMAFPNEFYKHTKEIVFDPVTFMNTELNAILDRVVATEANKWEVLRELEQDMEMYPSGDYPEIEEEASLPFSYRDYAKQGTAMPPMEEYTQEDEDEDDEREKSQKKKKKTKSRKKTGKNSERERGERMKQELQEKDEKRLQKEESRKNEQSINKNKYKKLKKTVSVKPGSEAVPLKKTLELVPSRKSKSKEADRATKRRKAIEEAQGGKGPRREVKRSKSAKASSPLTDRRVSGAASGPSRKQAPKGKRKPTGKQLQRVRARAQVKSHSGESHESWLIHSSPNRLLANHEKAYLSARMKTEAEEAAL
ncbi:CotS family spore coat protein [Paenibacillus sp. HB172176]|uniref:CotS family spore coat protein n=1 Tax=Paenibacillus sp. HB172176 TaxID=2493690 RepID=UPI00143C8450|nr:CotS family spore coat protein [Paenibacillus sp. HB172176]